MHLTDFYLCVLFKISFNCDVKTWDAGLTPLQQIWSSLRRLLSANQPIMFFVTLNTRCLTNSRVIDNISSSFVVTDFRTDMILTDKGLLTNLFDVPPLSVPHLIFVKWTPFKITLIYYHDVKWGFNCLILLAIPQFVPRSIRLLRGQNKAQMHSSYRWESYAQIFPCHHTCQVTLDIFGSPTDCQWGSRKYSE